MPGTPVWNEQAAQNADGRPLVKLRSLPGRCLPEFLQLSPETLPPLPQDVAVDARHARHLVAHSLRLEGLLDSEVVQPCPVTTM